MTRRWGEERFLDTVWLIQRRALITAVIVTAVTVGLAVWVWWRTDFSAWHALALQPTSTPLEAKLLAKLGVAVDLMKASLRLFVVEAALVAVGVTILITSYSRSVNRLIEMAELAPPETKTEIRLRPPA